MILHVYDPTIEDVKVENIRPRAPWLSFKAHTLPSAALLQEEIRVGECQDSLLALLSHFWHTTKVPLLPAGLNSSLPI